MIFSMLMKLLKALILLASPLLVAIFIIVILFFGHFFKYRYKEKIIPKKRLLKEQKCPGFFKKLFYLFPKQLAFDTITQDPNEFREFGVHMICGEQGAGKTITAIYLLEQWRSKYPKLMIFSNIFYKHATGKLQSWREIVLRNNGTDGEVEFIDEIQTWFSNIDSKTMPPDLLKEISQQRKQKKAVIGTAQVFGQIAKPLRMQTHFVYRPFTFFNCITFVFCTKAHLYDAEKDRFKKYTSFFFFVHTKELREAYDTFERVQKYSEESFSPDYIDHE